MRRSPAAKTPPRWSRKYQSCQPHPQTFLCLACDTPTEHSLKTIEPCEFWCSLGGARKSLVCFQKAWHHRQSFLEPLHLSRVNSYKTKPSFFDWLRSNGITRFDTAALYPVAAAGVSEKILGGFQRSNPGILVDTKILLTDFSGKGSLTPEAIARSLSASTSRLHNGVNTLYCHTPDPATSM